MKSSFSRLALSLTLLLSTLPSATFTPTNRDGYLAFPPQEATEVLYRIATYESVLTLSQTRASLITNIEYRDRLILSNTTKPKPSTTLITLSAGAAIGILITLLIRH